MIKGESYPLNVSAARKYCIDRWFEDYEAPVSGAEFQSFYERILAVFAAAANQEDDADIRRTVDCNYKSVLYLAHQCLYHLRLERLEAKGFKSIDDGTAIPIAQARDELSRGFFAEKVNLNLEGLVEKARYRWRLIRTNWGSCRPLPSMFPRISRNPTLLVGDRNVKELKYYTESLGQVPQTVQPRLLLSSRRSAPRNKIQAMDAFVERFVNGLRREIPEGAASLNQFFEERFRDYMRGSLSALLNCKNAIRHWQPRGLLITGAGNIHHRLFAAAWKSIGGSTAGFTHGNNFCQSYKPGPVASGAYAIIDDYIVSCAGEGELLELAKRDFDIGMPTFENIVVNPNNFYRPMAESLAVMPPVRAIREVMIIGYPMSFHYHTYHPEQHCMPHLHLEIKIMRALRQAGYRIIYKAHPDTFAELKGTYNQYADEIIVENFERVIDRADCVLFGSSATTTFGFTLLSNKPMVLVEAEGTPWHPRVLELLRRRCAIINTVPDGLGRLVFDDNDLITAVAESINRLDPAIVERYAF